MKPDGTDSFSTANEDVRLPMGTQVTGSTESVGADVKLCFSPPPATWSYLFVHHSRVAKFEEWLRRDGRTFFVHKTSDTSARTIQGAFMAKRCQLLLFKC